MKRIPSAEIVRNFSKYCDDALNEPLVLTRNGRDRLALINVQELERIIKLANRAVEASPGDLRDARPILAYGRQ